MMSEYLKKMFEAHNRARKEAEEKAFRDQLREMMDRQRRALGPNPQTQRPQRG